MDNKNLTVALTSPSGHQLMSTSSSSSSDIIPATKQEEWTSSKKVVRHKKRETETKVTRNIVMEDGVVIADSGPLVDSRSREEEHEEEEEGERREDPKRQTSSSSSEFPRILASGHLKVPGSDVIIDEVSSVKKTRNKTKKEHAQYHDESFNKLTGFEVHKKAITSPKELLVVQRETTGNSFQPKGNLSFYSVEGKTINDLEERRERSYFDRFTGKTETDFTTTTKQEIVEETEEPEEYAVNFIPETRRENQRHFYSYSTTNDEDRDSKNDFNNKVLFINDRVHDQDNCCLTPDPDPVFFTKPLQALVRVRRETGGSSSSDSDSITRLEGNRIRIDLQQESRAPSSSPLPPQTTLGGNNQQNRTFYFGTNNNNQEF